MSAALAQEHLTGARCEGPARDVTAPRPPCASGHKGTSWAMIPARIVFVLALLTAGATLPTSAASEAYADAAAARAASYATATAAAHHPDFNRDGYADLVVSAQYDTVNGA